jgi:peptidyl-prolyl cis-trans isomerase B (cyclophilin B)
MSKQSKSKREQKKKRRTQRAASRAQQRLESQSERDWTMWWWVGGIAAAVLVLGGVLWFTVGPGKSASPTPTVVVEPTEPAEAQEGAESLTMPDNPADRNDMYSAPPEMQIDPTKTYLATIETDKGVIELELYPQYAPETVNNFVFLAQGGFYDGVTFHRVISDFMIQGGDPTGTGAGGPGYEFADETEGNPLTHETGVISMANAGPNTNGSQFFITHSPQPHLDGKHTVFGKVISGQAVVNAVRQGDEIMQIKISVEG